MKCPKGQTRAEAQELRKKGHKLICNMCRHDMILGVDCATCYNIIGYEKIWVKK